MTCGDGYTCGLKITRSRSLFQCRRKTSRNRVKFWDRGPFVSLSMLEMCPLPGEVCRFSGRRKEPSTSTEKLDTRTPSESRGTQSTALCMAAVRERENQSQIPK